MHLISHQTRPGFPVSRLSWALLAAVLSAGLLAGCGGNKVVAVVNGQKIEQEEFYRQLERSHGVEVVNWLILRRLLKDECAKQGVTVPKEELDKTLVGWKQTQGFVGEAAYFQWLKVRNMSDQDVRDDLELEILKEKLRTKGVTVSDDEIKQFFDANKAALGRPALVTLGEVVCATKEKAEEARKKLVDGGDPGQVGAELGVADPQLAQAWQTNGVRNGVWPPRPKDGIYPTDLQKPAFELPVGDLSQPLKSSLGYYHVIKVLVRTAAEAAVLDKLKDQIRRELTSRKGKPEQELVKELAAKAKVKIERPAYLALQDQFGAPAVVPGSLPGAGKGDSKAATDGQGGMALPTPVPAPSAKAGNGAEKAGKSGQ
jgi:foldase protein PrsA